MRLLISTPLCGHRNSNRIVTFGAIESALRHSIRPEFSRPRFGFPAKNRQKKLKKSLPKFSASNKTPGQLTHNLEKVLTR